MSEVRTTSSTGGEKGVKPERMDLLPRYPLEVAARHYAAGAEKYADHNWRRGYEWSKSYASLMRHLLAFWDGEDIDEETGSPHLAGVIFHAFALTQFTRDFPEFDDRCSTVLGREAEEAETTSMYADGVPPVPLADEDVLDGDLGHPVIGERARDLTDEVWSLSSLDVLEGIEQPNFGPFSPAADISAHIDARDAWISETLYKVLTGYSFPVRFIAGFDVTTDEHAEPIALIDAWFNRNHGD